MKFSDSELVSRIAKRDFRAIARMITRIEGGSDTARALAASMRRAVPGRAHVVGVTGSPGAGKSTLVDLLAQDYRAQGKHVAVIAVDPSSPFSGGAILGDRIRMNRAAEDSDVFIRSMATRGSLGGLAKATLESIHILDCAGFDIILIETVGVGQAEVDIVRSADSCVVVLVPGMGDSVQIIKAGLMEIADVFVINKADRDGALALEKDLFTLLSLVDSEQGQWNPTVVKTIATEGIGISEVVRDAAKHNEWLENSSLGHARRITVLSHVLTELASERIAKRALAGKEALVNKLAREVFERKKNTLQAVEELVSG